MVWIILLAFVGFFIGASIEDAYDSIDRGVNGFFGALFGIIFGGIIGLIVGTGVYNSYTYKVTHKAALVSLADGAGIHGEFFLGSGYVDSAPTFTWYESNGNNSYVRKDADAESSTIHYLSNNTTKPYYTLREEKPADKGWLQTWGINFEDGWKFHYDFYVPRGSITTQYILDNK